VAFGRVEVGSEPGAADATRVLEPGAAERVEIGPAAVGESTGAEVGGGRPAAGSGRNAKGRRKRRDQGRSPFCLCANGLFFVLSSYYRFCLDNVKTVQIIFLDEN
jgi:hypothetical protein